MTDRLDQRRFGWVAATTAATIATHIEHLPAWLSISIATVIVARVATRQRGLKRPGAMLRVPLTLALVTAIVMSFGSVFGRGPGSALACGLLALKLLETEQIRDARVAIAFSCFVLMSSLLFASTLWFSIGVGSVLVVQVGALSVLQPRRSMGGRDTYATLGMAARLLAGGLPIAIAAFVLLPRLDTPLWGSRGNDGVGRTGLSETMSPGQFAQLMLDESPAFRVTFDGRTPRSSELYFRAIVLTDFDGMTWARRDDLGFSAVLPAPSLPVVAYDVTLEATSQRWLPALDRPFTAPPDARIDPEQLIFARLPVTQPLKYRVESSPKAQLSNTLTSRDRARTLRLPDGFAPRARELARQWRSEHSEDGEVVKAALQMFRANFTYSLEPPPLGRDSVDDFLFGTREGFCEHYASAFVVLMRAAGIPARVVTGYLGGWDADGYLLVRQSDAHAWAEVWRQGTGWSRVDPTAAVSPMRIELGAPAANASTSWMGDAWRSLRNQFDVASRLWTESIVRFDNLRQRGLLSGFGVVGVGHRDLLLGFAGLLSIAMFLAAAWAMRGDRALRGDALDRAWARLRMRLARIGINERPQEGPLDLLARTRIADAALAQRIAHLVDEYVTLRYACPIPPSDRVEAFARSARRLELPHRRRNVTKRHSATSS